MNDVTGDELDIDVSISLFHNLRISGRRDTTVVKKFQHVLGVCSSSQQRKLENRYHAQVGETGASCYGGRLLQGHLMQSCITDGEIADSSSILIHQRNH